MTPRPAGDQAAVDEYFDAASGYWNDVYEATDLQALIYGRRMETALAWVRELGVPASGRVLDAGCGAGLMSVALAREQFDVVATDSSSEMVALCRQRAAAQGVAGRVTVERADAQRLPFEDGQFSLVVALGLLPWLSAPQAAIAEFGRVLVGGGWLIVTADNQRRLNRLVEPRESPVLAPLKLARRELRERAGHVPGGAPSYRHRAEDVDRMLRAAALVPMHRTTVGYGPFSFLSRPLLPDAVGTRLHLSLERSAVVHPRLRRVGWHYMVAARKD